LEAIDVAQYSVGEMPRACPQCAALYDSDLEFCGVDGTRLVDGDPLVDRTIGHYRVIERIGLGGIGAVYRAHDLLHHEDVALKVLKNGVRATLVARFAREAGVIRSLEHANIVRLLEFGSDDRLTFLAMELVLGRTIAEILERDGPFTLERTASIGAQICAGLAEAHRIGFVHRDLKPTNLMLAGAQPGEVLKILDFGVAGILDEDAPITRLTRTGHTVGTPMYMAPEQASSSTVGPEADLYAVGIILYEMIAGRPPFYGTVQEVVMKHIVEAPPALPLLHGLEDIVGALLEKDPLKRPSDANAVRSELEAVRSRVPTRIGFFDTHEEPTVRAPKPSTARSIEEPIRPPERPRTLTLAFVSLLVLILAVSYLVLSRPPDEPKAVEDERPAIAAPIEPRAIEPRAIEDRASESPAIEPRETAPTKAREESPAPAPAEENDPKPIARPKPSGKTSKVLRAFAVHAEMELKREMRSKGLSDLDLASNDKTSDLFRDWERARKSRDPDAIRESASALSRAVESLPITVSIVRAKLARLSSDIERARPALSKEEAETFSLKYLDLSEANRGDLQPRQYEALAIDVQELIDRVARARR
jgi:hypothetical protein